MADKKKIKSTTKHLILCEGADEKYFFIWFLDYFKKQYGTQYDKYNEIQLEDAGGNDEISGQLNAWRIVEGFDNLKTVGIIRDAEKNALGAIQAVKNCFSNNDLQSPSDCFELNNNGDIRTVFGILPGNKDENGWSNGTLEDLCIGILKDCDYIDKLNLVDEFLKESQTKFNSPINHIHKAKLHTYFSSNEPFIGSKIGEAAKFSAFNFESARLANFKKMFDDIVE